MKLLLDEMWPPSIAEQLRQRGHDAVAVSEREDLRSTSDAIIVEVAQHEEFTILTENSRDFRIRGRSHHGCIYTTDRQFPRGDASTAGRLVRALEMLLETTLHLTDREHWLSPPHRAPTRITECYGVAAALKAQW